MGSKPDWYVEKRKDVSEVFERASAGETVVHHSPSGNYRLEIKVLSTGQNTWSYSRGRVFSTNDNRLVSEVHRNFSNFPFSWCEVHPSGHAYLVCGEDYQCQTVIELDTGARVDHVDEAAKDGTAFCWAAHYPSPDGRLLFVDGCIWAWPYELVLFDFTDPMRLPYREIHRWPVWEVQGFQEDGSFVFEYAEEVRKSDGKPVSELTDGEEEELDKAANYEDVVREQKYRVTWRPDRPAKIVEVTFLQ